LHKDIVVTSGYSFSNRPRSTIRDASHRDDRIVLIAGVTSGLCEKGLEELANIGVVASKTLEIAALVERCQLMIGLFFEVEPLPGHADRYFELAVHLRTELIKNPGLMFIDRYKSVDRPSIVLSHSWWADEAALIAWRQNSGHRAIQRAGRDHHFKDYRIRIGRLSEAATEPPATRRVWATYLEGEPSRRPGGEQFKSVNREGQCLILSDEPLADPDLGSEQRIFEVIRDYTMYERAEAPQHYPPIERR
jgi:heme-degrading monooxygenase HmoA